MLKTVIVSPPAKNWTLCPYPLLGPSILKSFLDSKGYKIDLVDLSVRVRNLNRYPIGKYAFLEKSSAYMEDNFDEIGGLEMEDRKKRDRAKQKILERLIRREIRLKLILKLMGKYPLYPLKKKISHRYLNYDEYLL